MSWEQVYDYQMLYEAYLRARKEKRYRREVLEFSYNLEENLISLQNELIWKTYVPGEYRTFLVHEPKTREIAAAPFRDRVVQHALHAVMEPAFERVMYHDSFACRVGKGTHEAARRVAFMAGKPENQYYLKGDISKYFHSIPHDVIRRVVRFRIHDENVLWLLDQYLEAEKRVAGIKIGLLSSQLLANVVLHELDHHVKQDLGVRWYVRYMDDWLIFSDSKRDLRAVKRDLEYWIPDTLGLTINPKTRIARTENGIPFVGYRIWPDNKLIKKESLQRMRRKVRAWRKGKMQDEWFLASIGSWMGHARNTASHHEVEALLLQSLRYAIQRGGAVA